MSPESANNAAVQTAFIPTLTLGIPGSATMAVMMGALMIHGIAARAAADGHATPRSSGASPPASGSATCCC